jgi:2-methylisocitrate lyase-like PEP mutase family enzyme
MLRDLISGPDLVVVPEAYSALTGRLVEMSGFAAAYCGGHALGGMHYAVPDHGLITISEMVDLAARIADAVSIPLIADADQAGETTVNVRRTVKMYEKAGVAGIHIEDTINPKHLYDGDRLMPINQMVARIDAAVDAREDENFVLIARTDSLFNKGSVEEAIERGQAYAAAGADVFMCLSTPIEAIDSIAAHVPVPLLDIRHPVERAKKTRLKLDVMTGDLVSQSAWVAMQLLDELKEYGELRSSNDRRIAPEIFAEAIHDDEYLVEGRRWAAATRISSINEAGDAIPGGQEHEEPRA